MATTLRFVEQHWPALILPLSVTGITILMGLTARNLIFRAFRRLAAGTKSKLDVCVANSCSLRKINGLQDRRILARSLAVLGSSRRCEPIRPAKIVLSQLGLDGFRFNP
jgi:hypothetical protein